MAPVPDQSNELSMLDNDDGSVSSYFSLPYVTRFAKPRHNDAFLEIQIIASMSSIYLKLCSVAIAMLYCKYVSSYKAR